jgi:hypothetical protein
MFEKFLHLFEFPQEIKYLLIVYHNLGGEDCLKRFDIIKNVLEIKAIPPIYAIAKLNLLRN